MVYEFATSVPGIKVQQQLLISIPEQSRWLGIWMNEELIFLLLISSPFNLSLAWCCLVLHPPTCLMLQTR